MSNQMPDFKLQSIIFYNKTSDHLELTRQKNKIRSTFRSLFGFGCGTSFLPVRLLNT